MRGTTDGETFTFEARDGTLLTARRWLPPEARTPKAAVQIAHGAAEHGLRYARVASFLADAGYAVYADDHRGHGLTAGSLEARGLAGKAGAGVFDAMVDDQDAFSDRIRDDYPRAPIYLLGHSMGSLLAQRYAQRFGAGLQGLVLSGTFGVIEDLDARVAALLPLATGPVADQPSEAFAAMFASFNDPFVRTAGADAARLTGFEWLSRDAAEVKKYVDDPWCGFPFSNAFAASLLAGAREAWRPENERAIPNELPTLVICGAADPAGGDTAAVTPLLERYRGQGLRDLTVRFYPDARHELFNEVNREEVQAELLAWLEARLTSP